MAKILILYYSSYGHIQEMAEALAEGARSALAQVDIRVGSSRVDLQACKLEYSIVSPK